MRILIIEDEKLLADSLKALLEQNGFEADAACDGKTGEYYAALGIYDLLILDVMMPGRDGYEVARRLRERRMEMNWKAVVLSEEEKKLIQTFEKLAPKEREELLKSCADMLKHEQENKPSAHQ